MVMQEKKKLKVNGSLTS